MKLFVTKKKKEKAFRELKESISVLRKAEECLNVDIALMALLDATSAARTLGFKSLEAARQYYHI